MPRPKREHIRRTEENIDRLLGRKPLGPTPNETRPAKPAHAQSAEDYVGTLRVLKIVRLLQSRWWRVKELAEATGRDEKTVRRDLAVISRARFQVQVKVEAFGKKAYRVDPRKSKTKGRPPLPGERRNRTNQVSFGNQLRDAIKGSGLTMYRIAKESGVQQTILSRFATGERNVQLDTAEKLAAYFGMSLTPPKKPNA